MAVRKRQEENLSKDNLKKVIALLEGDNPITKKAACEILNISYNTSRLNKIIEEFKEREARAKRRRAELRGKPLSEGELAIIAQEYLNGNSITAIAESIYRSTALVNKAIKELNIPVKDASNSYMNPPFIEDSGIKEEYNKGDLVYSARYQVPALVEKKLYSVEEGPVYRIYLLGSYQMNAVQPFWELSDLTKVQNQLNVKLRAEQGLQPTSNPGVRKA